MQSEVSEKLLSSNAYFLMLLNETLDLNFSCLNTQKEGLYQVNVPDEKFSSEKVEVFIDCPFGEGFFRIDCQVDICVTEAQFQGDYDSPPDCDEIETETKIESVYFCDSDDQEHEIDVNMFKRLKELVSKVESKIVCS